MDPVSTTASILTVLGAAGSTCKVIYNAILDFKDAPHDIKLQNKKLQCLHGTINCLLHVCKSLPEEFQLASHLMGMDDFIRDISFINVKIQRQSEALDRRKIIRIKESCKWFLFDRELRKFFDNLEHYNMILSHAVSIAQIALTMQTAHNTATPTLQPAEVSSGQLIHPEAFSMKRGIVRKDSHIGAAEDVSMTRPTTKRLFARLSSTSEPAGVSLQRRCQAYLGPLLVDFRLGPAITRRWSRKGQAMYTVGGSALSLDLQFDCLVCRKLTCVLYVLSAAKYFLKLNIQCSLNYLTPVPLDNPDFKAVQVGDIDHVRRMISIGSLSISTTTPGGYTLLHCAARYGQADILAMLVENGADVNMTNARGQTPLHVSLSDDRWHTCAQHLLELGADPCQPDIQGRTALHVFYNPFTAHMLQYHVNDIDTWAQDNSGMTILHYLSWSSRSSAHELLRCIDAGASTSRTPGSKVISQISVKDFQGKSLLHYAAQRGNIGLISFLLAQPEAATLSMPDHHGRTLLHYATESSRTQAIDIFLSKGIDIHKKDGDGRTMTHHACQWGNVKAVEHLISLGFEYQLNIVDHNKRTPKRLAELWRSHAVLHYLQEFHPNQASCKHSAKTKEAQVHSFEVFRNEVHIKPADCMVSLRQIYFCVSIVIGFVLALTLCRYI